jgi:hypothetical protein
VNCDGAPERTAALNPIAYKGRAIALGKMSHLSAELTCARSAASGTFFSRHQTPVSPLVLQELKSVGQRSTVTTITPETSCHPGAGAQRWCRQVAFVWGELTSLQAMGACGPEFLDDYVHRNMEYLS